MMKLSMFRRAQRPLLLFVTVLFTAATFGQYASAAIDTQFFDSNKILYYDPTACDPDAGSGSGTLTGKDEKEKIWNWLKSNGLSDEQAAGVMGNMQAESGFVPTRHQSEGDVWSSTDKGGNAWGLVQWDNRRRFTSPDRGVLGALRKNNPTLEKYADIKYDYARHPSAKADIPPADLDALTLYELDYLKQESQSRPVTAHGFGNADNEWATLKLQKTVEDATVFWHNNFEVSGDSPQEVLKGRGGFAKDILKEFGGTKAAATPSAAKVTVFLDPGHGGAIPDYTDSKTGILTNETDNSPERENVLDVANQVKALLEKAGYNVVLARTNNTAKVKFRERADAAAAANASIGVSIHTSPGGPNDAWSQHDGYREHDGHRDTFGDTDEEKATMEKSQSYAKAIASARTQAEGHQVGLDANFAHQTASFGRGGNIKSPGNIPLVALWSPSVPWVYNEIAQDGPGASITDKTKAAYAKGIAEGIQTAVPPNTQAGDCSGSNFAGGNFNQTLLAYAWPEHHNPNWTDKTPAYAKAIAKANAAGRYVGGDPGVYLGIDCGGFVTTLMVDSGFEPKYNYGSIKADGAGNTINQKKWLDANWQNLGRSDGMNAADLKPGDVAINGGHTYVWVGQVEGFQKPVASASYSGGPTGSGLGWRAPMAGNEGASDPGYIWYRKK